MDIFYKFSIFYNTEFSVFETDNKLVPVVNFHVDQYWKCYQKLWNCWKLNCTCKKVMHADEWSI